MAVSIERCYMVSFDNSPTWKVSKDNVKTINGDDFVRLRPYDTSFVRMVMDSQLPKGTKKVSLAATEGFRSLVKLQIPSSLRRMTAPISLMVRMMGCLQAMSMRRNPSAKCTSMQPSSKSLEDHLNAWKWKSQAQMVLTLWLSRR